MLTIPVLLLTLLSPLTLRVQVVALPSASVPPGAQRVEMLSLRFTAPCDGDATVHGITVTHGGMGDPDDFSSVYVLSDGRRISRGRSLSSTDGSVPLSLYPAWIVPACGTRTLSVAADFGADAAVAGEHRLTIDVPAHVDAGGYRVTFSPAPVTVTRTTTGIAQGSVSVEFLPVLSRIRYGAHRSVARLRLTAQGDFDQVVESITLTNDGSARGTDLQNLMLQTSRGQVLASLPSLRGDLAPFVLASPLRLNRGQVILLEVRADMRASARRTVGFTLEEPSDLFARRVRTRR
ncbi:MAG TPA: hypothetical protein DEB30_02630 [Candidatus Peribacter riflensis]|uniref:Uncharacterized protein n=1 Tax=Candidatus Peribacter riflensis TaxID=1735162 RepID=A0A0S1SMR2_9BACT|nr:MAG: hypothetical protein PeribacterA2_0541 [Candidatus Peribacter riflensis]OGJ77072.1 MAG: hypothetical protein A2398_03025 [Candidatus Peribacteria bacterium RIFOXYB1_FULL_57_12]ALM11021.1 MAG: hypothetical protein PeribacterB2_0540 [Candidatus Peribacter riflensis]ALM12124.1 MAG: hypothetical protein PeribacterC2_0540 [Candidatus Peribacter riflensis]ALM13227.1 MAG: hypothetical protein PeribacterD1_0541 [Candidatus Peribacter riflensis]